MLHADEVSGMLYLCVDVALPSIDGVIGEDVVNCLGHL